MGRVIKFPATPTSKKPYHELVNERTREERAEAFRRFKERFMPKTPRDGTINTGEINPAMLGRVDLNEYQAKVISKMVGYDLAKAGESISSFGFLNSVTGELRHFDTFEAMVAFAKSVGFDLPEPDAPELEHMCPDCAARGVINAAEAYDTTNNRNQFPELFKAIDVLKGQME